MAKVPKDTLTFKQMRLSRLHNGDSIYLNAAPCRDKVLTNTRVDVARYEAHGNGCRGLPRTQSPFS